MSDEKPFAYYSVSDRLVVCGIDVDEVRSEAVSERLCAAVAARERKAAAKALRGEADEIDQHIEDLCLANEDGAYIAGVRYVMNSLRSRAAAIEGGAT